MEPVFTEQEPVTPDPDKAIDAEIQEDPDKLSIHPFGNRNRKDDGRAKSGAPNVDEWLDFFSRIVIRFLTEWYVDFTFRKIDENLVTDSDAEKLLLTEDERNVIARPFAEYANKNPYLRKHGRQIVALADSFESMVIMAQWFARVNRIARKYTRMASKPVIKTGKEAVNVDNSQGAASQNGYTAPAGFGGITIHNPGTG